MMDRRYPKRPMVGVGAVIFRGESVLLVCRGREPGHGKWSVPGGLVEVGESLDTAVRREVREEVGLEVKVLDLTAVLDRVIYDAQENVEYHYVLLDFLCEAGEGEPSASSDVSECAFAPVSALSHYLMTRGTEEVIRRAWNQAQGRSHPVYDASL